MSLSTDKGGPNHEKTVRKSPGTFFNIGASSLLVIFLILCLVTFAILTLTSAKSDADFAEKLAHHKMNYYAPAIRQKAPWMRSMPSWPMPGSCQTPTLARIR
ncbi:MAG: hypothetical protein ACLR5Q_09685 [Coprococcus sp.]